MNIPHIPESIQADNLMWHMHTLCKEIGPRPPTSHEEREAAAYVIGTLHALGYENVAEQPFKSQNSYGWVGIPAAAAAAISMPLAALGGSVGKALGGALMLWGAHSLKQFNRARPQFFQPLVARWDSQNVWVDIPPRGERHREVVLIAHTDTQKQRFMAPPPNPALMKPFLTLSPLLLLLGGASLWRDVLRGRKKLKLWQWLIGAFGVSGLVSSIADEFQPHIEGAADNASAVSILLGIAEALRTSPLEHTQVKLLFTGCEEPICVGIESYLRDHEPPRDNTYWIDLDHLGSGKVCYVTRHGISYLTEYEPAPELVALAEHTAHRHPELGVVGKRMTTLDEVSNLTDHGYKGIMLTTYGEDDALPHWHRLSDRLENIDSQTLECAARFAWALLHEIDDN